MRICVLLILMVTIGCYCDKKPTGGPLADGQARTHMVGCAWGQDLKKLPTRECWIVFGDEPFGNATPQHVHIACLGEPAEDVLAIQEKPRTYVLKGCAQDELEDCGMRIQHWTCADKKRVLLESVDGSIHVCHKVSEGNK